MNRRYIELAEEDQKLRSTSSLENDPVLPTNMDPAGLSTIHEGMFLSRVNKKYVFMYKIHLHCPHGTKEESHDHHADSSKGNKYSWSFYTKILGKTRAIWKYHRFSEEFIREVMHIKS